MRKGADLAMDKEITLLEALTGVDFVITHLDGKKIRIANRPGEVIKPEDIKTIENHGMPCHKKTYNQGNLFVHFKIKFPTSIDTKSLGLVQEALSEGGKAKTPKAPAAEDGTEVVYLVSYEEHHRNAHHGGGDRGNDSEDDEDDSHPHGQRVGCQSQ